MIACLNGNVHLIKAFVNAGSNVNTQNEIGMTPLHSVTLKGNIHAFSVLLDCKADFMLMDKVRTVRLMFKNNLLPIHYAVIKDKADLLKYLQTQRQYNVLSKKYYYDG